MGNQESVVRFKTEDVREILRRALAMENAMEGSLTLDELTAVGRDVGIREESIKVAAAEYQKSVVQEGQKRRSFRHSTGLAIAGTLIGAYAGSIERLYYLPFSIPYTAMFVVSGGIAFTAHRAGRLKTLGTFQTKNMTLHFGSIVGIFAGGLLADAIRGTTTTVNNPGNIIGHWLAMLAASTLVGGAVALWRGKVASQDRLEDISLGLPLKTRFKRACRTLLKGLVDRIFAERQRIREIREANA